MFKQGKISKTYWAVVEGGPAGDEGLIDKPLGRRDASRGWWMKHDEEGLPSQTRWRALGRGVDPASNRPLAWLALNPSQAGPISSGFIRRAKAGPFSAIQSTARRRAKAGRCCIFMRGRSSCRSTRTGIR